ncbi:uncharacterized protein LOC130511362 [Raphanus sativus]|uniref:Uncharacterized protein LOC130511362 n=1 Tax=Raphanus sativus TaxID=3726 RepID=A0A9W3DK84_RAPSA|nr:uncharacterized protein LOC130511362 [Raphanus sativus]
MFPASCCNYLRYEGSDHRPLLTYLDAKKVKKRRPFRYDRRLNDNEDARKIIEEAWQKGAEETVEIKISRCRKEIIKWSKIQKEICTKAMILNQQELEKELSAAVPDSGRIVILTEALSKAYREEELFWRQRSRILWLQGGDRNSAFFHAVTKVRTARNQITTIENAEGVPTYEEEDVGKVFEKFYQQLYSSNGESDFSTVEETITCGVTEEMNDSICKIPDQEEVRQALFSINGGKAPGADGFSASFYQSFWSLLGPDIYREIRSFFTTGTMTPRINETHVCLIPKIEAPKTAAEYRPIALCTVRYKIIAKLLTKRLQQFLPSLISQHQTAFVPGRAISDNILVTHETLHYLKNSEAVKRCSMVIKTDMSKAYDRIEWDFLEQVLSKLGFRDICIRWIMECVTTVTYSFLINGAPQGMTTPSRGLRQGDPLSPYLFILCTEVLSGLCKIAQGNGRLLGLQVSQRSPYVNHLLFADDTMIFCKTNERNCRALSDILKRYELSSGQCINQSKSTITFSSKTPESIKERVKSALGITNEGGMGKYLGLPETFGRRKKDVFTGMVDKIRQRSQSWTTRFLSGAGKHVMLQSVLTALPTYSMSSFKIPISLCKRIQSILTRFWWDSSPDVHKIAWVAWSTMALPKSMGGLGFKNFEEYNDSLLAKLGWRIMHNPDSLLSRVLKGKYFPDNSFLESGAKSGASHGWISVMAGKAVLEKGLGFIVGNGESIKVWSDRWLSSSKPEAPIGPPTLDNQELMVADLLNPQTNDWDLEKIRLHLPQYEEKIRLIIPSSLKPRDRQVWLPDASGIYSAKSGYRKLFEEELVQPNQFDWKKEVWNLKVPPKIQHFLWRVLKEAIPVGSLLAIRGIQSALNCKRCGELESISHLFTSCPFAVQFWSQVPLLPPTANQAPSLLFSDWYSSQVHRAGLPPLGVISSPLVPWFLWNLWTARNKLVFEGKVYQVEDIISKAIAEARAWEDANLGKKTLQLKLPSGSSQKLSPYLCWIDGAWQESSRSGGMGWIIKNREGAVICRGSSNRTHVGSALIAEALALRNALKQAKDLLLPSLHIFSDSQVLVTTLCEGRDMNEIAGILTDIRNLATLFCPISYSFIPRLENTQADSLARASLARLVM